MCTPVTIYTRVLACTCYPVLICTHVLIDTNLYEYRVRAVLACTSTAVPMSSAHGPLHLNLVYLGTRVPGLASTELNRCTHMLACTHALLNLVSGANLYPYANRY